MEFGTGNAGGAGETGGGPATPHLDADLLSAYVDGALDPDARAAAAAHLAGCDACRRDLAELQATVTLLRGLPQHRPRRSFQLTPEQARPTGRGRLARFLPTMPALRAATIAIAIVLLAVVAGDIIWNRDQDGGDGNLARAPGAIAPTATAAPFVDQDGDGRLGEGAPGAAAPTATTATGTQPTASTFFQAEGPTAAPTSEPGLPTPPPVSTIAPAPPAAPAGEEGGKTEMELPGAAAGGEAEADAGEESPSIGAAAPTEESFGADEAAPAEAEEPKEAIGDAMPGAPAPTEQIESRAAADVGTSAEPTAEPTVARRQQATPAGGPAGSPASTPAASPIASPAGSPAATPASPTAAVERTATVPAEETSSAEENRTSGWRVAEVGLLLVLAWLLVSVVGLIRLRRGD